jgi:hypothetical protein
MRAPGGDGMATSIRSAMREVDPALAVYELRTMDQALAIELSSDVMLTGLGIALVLARGMRSFLYGIGPVDPPTYIAAAAVLTAVMFIAA